VKYCVDTNVFVAAFFTTHAHHHPSIGLLKEMIHKNAAAATHTLAEAFAIITRLPVAPKPAPYQVHGYLSALGKRTQWIDLSLADYETALAIMEQRQLTGAKIFDALLVIAAQKFDAEVIYTWDVKDFTALTEGTSITIRTPDDL